MDLIESKTLRDCFLTEEIKERIEQKALAAARERKEPEIF